MSAPRIIRRTEKDYPAVLQKRLGVAALANALLVPYAAPDGKTWTTVHAALKRNQPVFTFDVSDNAELLESGARSFELLFEQANI